MMHNILRKNYIYISGMILLIGFSCAIVRAPEGGPKDFTPPKLVSSDPANYTVNFNKNRIILTFDEFIQLKDMQQAFLISPPSKKRVMPKLRGNNKEVIVEFEDDLKPNTTYTLDFGNAITDLHEGNPLPNLTFTFSTGSTIDSLSLTGRVVDAFAHKPNKESLYVMLYPMFNDTIPRKTLPSYITKTNWRGWFTIPNIHADTFMIFALKDGNMNMMFDLANEQIAFSDTLIVFDSSYYQKPDSVQKKIVFSDSVTLDSIDLYKDKKSQIDLFFFQEETGKQNFHEYARPQPNQFSLTFALPPDSLNMVLLNPETAENAWFIKDNVLNNDTLNFWITDTTLHRKDTLLVKLSYMATDSLDKPYLKNDTLQMIFKRPTVKAKRAALAKAVPRLTIASSSSSKSEVDLNDHIFLESSLPVRSFDKAKMTLYMKEDSFQSIPFDITRDSVYLRRFNLSFKLEAEREYRFVYDTIAFTSIFGQNNDSTAVMFKTRGEEYYGTIKLNLLKTKGSMIVQLLNETGNLVRQTFANSDELIVFNYLAPGKYRFKVIYDRNGNKKWDTGNWSQRLQPEKTEFLNEEISLSSNWEKEINWELSGK